MANNRAALIATHDEKNPQKLLDVFIEYSNDGEINSSNFMVAALYRLWQKHADEVPEIIKEISNELQVEYAEMESGGVKH